MTPMPSPIKMTFAGAQQPGGAAYDSVWAQTAPEEAAPVGLERTMLAEDKLFVVLAVVLIIWAGLAWFILRTDQKLSRLERNLAERIPPPTE